MNGRERILAMLEGRPVDQLPLMPITMMFAGDHGGVKYGAYASDYRVLAEAQTATAFTTRCHVLLLVRPSARGRLAFWR